MTGIKRRTFALVVLFASLVVWLAAPHATSSSPPPRASGIEPQRRRQGRRAQSPRRAPQGSRRNYTNFSHLTPQHRQACDACHTVPTDNWPRVRRAGDAFPDVTDYPDHPSCINCHRQQFFTGARPQICTVCHTVVSPREGPRHPFQNPGENVAAAARRKSREASEFGINFPHDRHQDVMALVLPSLRSVGEAKLLSASFQQPTQGATRPVDSCTICHQTYRHPQETKDATPKAAGDDEYVIPPPAPLPENELRLKAYWLKKGTFKTSPTGHDSCFNCHWQEGGERPLSNDCAGCHTLLGPEPKLSRRARLDVDVNQPFVRAIDDAEILEKWANRKAANFRHERSEHLDVGCTACHINITTINRLDVNTLDVPILTCSSSRCHGSTRSPKGTLVKEIEQRRKPDGARYACVECHMNYGREPIPPSHENTLPAPRPK